MHKPGSPWRREHLVWLAGAGVLVLLVVCRTLVLDTAVQLLAGAAAALAALPLMRVLEKKLRPGLAAALSLLLMGAGFVLAVLLVVPSLVQQARQLVALAPSAVQRATEWLARGERWLAENGVPVTGDIRSLLASKGEEWLSGAAPTLLAWAQRTAGGFGKWLLAPVIGFYFLRDRQHIGRWLLLMVPVGYRSITVKLLRDIRRETAGYLRGQLMLSLAVGGFTAAGLLVCGIPAWLLLGAVMGLLELIPYVGPFVGGAVVLLFGLQAGTGRMLWALAVVLAVQQLESGWLSPKMMSEATRLHPLAVMLSLLVGSTAAGVAGILLAVPLVLCLRSALRIWSLSRSEWARQTQMIVKER